MKKIKLSQDKETIVDDEDYEYLNQWKWYCNNGYAVRNSVNQDSKRISIKLHRLICILNDNEEVDHINNDKLDNRRSNLRAVNHHQNVMNRSKGQNRTSKFKGVCFRKKTNKWLAQITTNKKVIFLGSFKNEEDAAKAYNEAAIKYFGEFAKLNKDGEKLEDKLISENTDGALPRKKQE